MVAIHEDALIASNTYPVQSLNFISGMLALEDNWFLAVPAAHNPLVCLCLCVLCVCVCAVAYVRARHACIYCIVHAR